MSIITTAVKPLVPPSFRPKAKMGLRRFTTRLRLLPDFIIVGAQRCGTTSLYSYLIQHPCIGPAFKKEIHFFDVNFRNGVSWYRAHFPTILYGSYCHQVSKQDFLTGEASPYYLFHPHVPERILKIVPRVRLIVLLRNPIDRAYSHYHREVKIGAETLSFEDAIKTEEERLHGEIDRMLKDNNYCSFNHRHYSYLSRGIYVDQLKIWMNLFPREQILIIKSEDFYVDPATTVEQVSQFLNLSNWNLQEYTKHNEAVYTKLDATTRRRLFRYFEPHNKELYEYLGRDFDWNE